MTIAKHKKVIPLYLKTYLLMRALHLTPFSYRNFLYLALDAYFCYNYIIEISKLTQRATRMFYFTFKQKRIIDVIHKLNLTRITVLCLEIPRFWTTKYSLTKAEIVVSMGVERIAGAHSFIKYSVSWIFQYLSPSCSIYRPTAMFPDMAVNAVLGILECNANVSVFCSR